MSVGLTRASSFRKPVRPILDTDDDDDQRRTSSGRKRVEVIQCLLDTSPDEEDEDVDLPDTEQKPNHVLWLTFEEICHIRYVLTRINLTYDKKYVQIRRGHTCFRCRKDIDELFFLPSFLRPINHEVCFICKQIICQKCAYFNFQQPVSKLLIPIRIQTLMKPPSESIENKTKPMKKTNKQAKTICYDCLQIFKEHIKNPSASPPPPQTPKSNPASPLRRTFSLPPASSKPTNENQPTVHRRRRPPPPAPTSQTTANKPPKITITKL